MTKKLYVAIRYEYQRDDQEGTEEQCDHLDSAAFNTRKEAEGWALENIKIDLRGEGFSEDDIEDIIKSHREGNYIRPSSLETLVLPIGYDLGAVETAKKAYHYRIRENYLTLN